MIKFIYLFIFITFQIHLYSIDNYVNIKLPKGFQVECYTKSLNNAGQIAGTINKHAAFWDLEKGIIILDQINYDTTGCVINDLGNIAGFAHINQHSQTSFLWNVTENKIVPGPSGYGSTPYAINNADIVLVFDKSTVESRTKVWESNTGEIRDYSYVKDINNKGELLSSFVTQNKLVTSYNDKGNCICGGHNGTGYFDMLFYSLNKFYNIPLPFGSQILFGYGPLLNNQDVVIFLATLDPQKNEVAIAKWQREKGTTLSTKLQDVEGLGGFVDFKILGFNDQEHILLGARRGRTRLHLWEFFLLIPTKN